MTSETSEKAPTLTGLLFRHCLSPEGTPADHARGRLAGLRKLLSPATRNQGLFALGSIGFYDWERDPSATTVAGLFGLYPHRAEKWRNFGTTCRELASKGGATPGDSPLDRHFRRILAARTLDDLLPSIRRVGRVAKASGVTIHYEKLHRDLQAFHRDPDSVLESWAKSYFDTREPTEA